MTQGFHSRHKNIALTVKYPRRYMRLQHHTTVLCRWKKSCKAFFAKKRCGRGAKRVLFPPDIDHQLPKFDSKCYVFMPWIQSVCHAEQPVQSSLPEISMFWPSTTEPSGPGGRHLGALTKSKKITSPERTSCDCLLIRTVVSRLEVVCVPVFPELFP